MRLRMQLHKPTERDQSGFSVIEVLLVVLVIAVMAVTGFVVYQRSKSNAKDHASINSSQSTGTTQNTTTTKPTQMATQYLTVKEWGVRLTLDSTTASLYYYINPQNPDVA